MSDGDVCLNGKVLATGRRRDPVELEAVIAEARRTIGEELQRFAENTLEYVRREAELTFAPLVLPADAHRLQRAATSSSSSGATTTRRTCGPSGPTSPSTSPSSSASTAGPTPCSSSA